MTEKQIDWRNAGVRIVRHDQLDPTPPRFPGVRLDAGTTTVSAGASKIWAGAVLIQPNAKTAAHHHGELESVIKVF